MSEIENTVKSFKIIKTIPGSVLFKLSPVDNDNVRREIWLTSRHPEQVLPENWALGIFANDQVFELYRQKAFTFDRPEEITKLAIERGFYFEDASNIVVPAKPNQEKEILNILKSGERSKINTAMKQYGQDVVKNVAVAHVTDLTQGVIAFLQNTWKIVLTIDGVAE